MTICFVGILDMHIIYGFDGQNNEFLMRLFCIEYNKIISLFTNHIYDNMFVIRIVVIDTSLDSYN